MADVNISQNTGAVTSRANYPSQLAEGLDMVFQEDYTRKGGEWMKLAKFRNIGKKGQAVERQTLNFGLGVAGLKEEGVQHKFDSGGEAYTQEWRQLTYSLAVRITKEARADNLYGDIARILGKDLATALAVRKEIEVARIYNEGFANHKTADGVTLFSRSHNLSGGGTAPNMLATGSALSESSLEELCILIKTAVNERGIPARIKPTALVIPNELSYIAHRVMNATGRPGLASNDPNALKDMNTFPEGIIECRYLTSPKAFYIKTDAGEGVQVLQKQGIQRAHDMDINNNDFVYTIDERYAVNILNWRGIYGSTDA